MPGRTTRTTADESSRRRRPAARPESGAAAAPFDKLRILAGHELFGQLTTEQVAKVVAHARLERRGPGQMIFRKGAPGNSLIAVLSGRVRIFTESPDGKEIVLNVIHPGEVFGEIALLDGRDRTAHAATIESCHLLVLDRRDFIPFLESHPQICIRLIAVLCARLRRTSEQVQDMMFFDLPSRLAKTLLRLADRYGAGPDGARRIALRVSQRELGSMVGASRESVNRLMHEWAEAGWLRRDGRTIVLTDPPALEALTER